MKKLLILLAFISVSAQAQEFFTVQNGDLYGIINDKGTEIIAPKYHYLGNFDEMKSGWAKVGFEGLFGFVDKLGKETVEVKYQFIGLSLIHI